MKSHGTQIIGIWDDHDYGINNGDMTYYNKNLTRRLFLDFIEEPEQSPRRKDINEGIY